MGRRQRQNLRQGPRQHLRQRQRTGVSAPHENWTDLVRLSSPSVALHRRSIHGCGFSRIEGKNKNKNKNKSKSKSKTRTRKQLQDLIQQATSRAADRSVRSTLKNWWPEVS